ncbi:MAG: hypothetical protein NTZ57_00130, partial [Deltaproteobacteria bacterium]|nr:hypothetical protein [Deltaproteobacteria bacterium]
MIRQLYEFIYEVHKLPFPSEIQVIRKVVRGKVFPRLWRFRAKFRSIFCTELIAESYIRMGLLPAMPPSSAYLPPDFTSQRKLPLLKGAYLSNEVLIRLPR